MAGQTGLLTAMFAETVLVSYREIGQGNLSVPAAAPQKLPLPSTYASIVIFFGALSLIPGRGQPIAGAVGWGIVLATFLRLWQPGSNSIVGTFGATPAITSQAAPAAPAA